MRFIIRVRLCAAKEKIEKYADNRYFITLLEENHDDGNKKMLEMLSHYLGVPPSRIEFVSGMDKDDKILEIR
jgi:uncharacterized protein YggU (UPF0235/DUF167 family)